MRLIRFEHADKIIRKASEQSLPPDEQRQALAFVEEKLGRELTEQERARFVQVAEIAPAMVPGDDPVELRPVRRMSFTERSHVEIGIKGGQGRSGAELEQDATPLAIAIAAAALCLIAAFFLR